MVEKETEIHDIRTMTVIGEALGVTGKEMRTPDISELRQRLASRRR